jgi:hypothetical protein
MSFASDLSENDISKIIGLTVDIKMKMAENEIITGQVFSFIRENNILILLQKDDKDPLIINSFFVNLKQLKEIKISNNKIDVI